MGIGNKLWMGEKKGVRKKGWRRIKRMGTEIRLGTEFGQTNSVGQGMFSEVRLLVSEASQSSARAIILRMEQRSIQYN